MASGAEPYMQFGDTGIIYDIDYSPDGTLLALGTSTGFQVLNEESYELVHQEFTNTEVRVVKWFPKSKRLLVALNSFTNDTDKSISSRHILFDIKDSTQVELEMPIRWIYSFKGFTSQPMHSRLLHKNNIGASDNSQLISIITGKNEVTILDQSGWDVVNTFEFENTVFSTGLSKDGNVLWVGTVFSEVFLYDLNDFALIDRIVIRNDSNQSSVMEYSVEEEYAISYNSYFHQGLPDIINSQLLYHDLNQTNVIIGLAKGRKEIRSSAPTHLFYNTNNNQRLIIDVVEFDSFLPQQNLIRLKEFTNFSRNIKSNFPPPYFPKPFSADGGVMLSNGYFQATSDLFSVGALYNQPLQRIFPRQPQPTVFDFHPTEPDTLLTYSTNQNATGKSALELWNIPSRSIITSITDTVMYERGAYSSDGSLFITLDQPIDLDSNRINIWDTLEPLPDLFLKIYITDSWKKTLNFQIWNYDSNEFTPPFNLNFLEASPNNKEVLYDLWVTNIFSLTDNNVIHNFGGSPDFIAFSKDGENIYLSQNSSLGIFNLENINIVPFSFDLNKIIYVNSIEDVDKYIIVDQFGEIKIYNSNLSDLLLSFSADVNEINKAILTPNEKYLIIDNGIWNVENGECVVVYSNNTVPVEEIKVSANNKWFATKRTDGIIQVWDLEELVQQNTAVGEYVQY